MSRILSLSLAFITGRWKILWQALGSIVFGVAGVLIFSSALSLILYRLPTGANIAYTSEIIARKSPTVFDFLIALAGGSTAALAVSLKRFSATLPGVAIATALVPPLCAAGIGISFLDMSLISGAAFLFLLNLIGIFLASAITFAFLGFRRIKK